MPKNMTPRGLGRLLQDRLPDEPSFLLNEADTITLRQSAHESFAMLVNGEKVGFAFCPPGRLHRLYFDMSRIEVCYSFPGALGERFYDILQGTYAVLIADRHGRNRRVQEVCAPATITVPANSVIAIVSGQIRGEGGYIVKTQSPPFGRRKRIVGFTNEQRQHLIKVLKPCVDKLKREMA